MNGAIHIAPLILFPSITKLITIESVTPNTFKKIEFLSLSRLLKVKYCHKIIKFHQG